ncbi:death-on-curing family protein [Nostoc sp. PCC 7524]|uniref:type II toxin-antitoxin system death-on-curing family toxin n=1 Tax=Nostoc sp. (strain ATCC 29411 / PCC 7524) TaxID=28072 RepID=UPI00029EF900|nr:type II toxin-antitoxin system death-on-curing family toxin [Nostoc sp. PCC 7524]AFY51032.1 death-on-curing family protein [Nostoc sp. PCC 7524]
MSWQSNIFWLNEKIILAIHDDQLAVHGGRSGIRDYNLLLASLDRPKNLLAYGEPTPNIFDLAAAYAFGFTNNHAFIDGNKRVGFVAAATFLELNGYSFDVPEVEVVFTFERLADKKETQESIGIWFKNNSIENSTE